MATGIIRNQKIWFDGLDLTGVSNSLSLDYSCDPVERTVLGDDTHLFKAGLKNVSAGVNGFFDAEPYDEKLFAEIGAAGKLLTFGSSGTEGDSAYMFRALAGQYSPEGSVGEMFKFSLGAAAEGKLLRGTLMENNAGITATGGGTARQLGAVSATQKIYAGIHVFDFDGSTPTLDVTIESNSTNSFAGAQTSRITHTQFTGKGSELKELAGSVSHTWWRAAYALGGGSPSFDFAVILAIF